MDKKESKRSLKLSPYFQYRPKKAKKSLLFSPTSSPSLKFNSNLMLKKETSGIKNFVRSQRICHELATQRKEIPFKNLGIGSRTAQKPKHSTFKINKQDNKKAKQLMKNSDYFLTKQRTIQFSRQRRNQTPRPKFDSQLYDKKSYQDLLQSRTIDSSVYERQIKRLEGSVNRYKAMHKNSLKKLCQVEEKAKQQHTKFQRVKHIYVERIKSLSRSLYSNKRSLGHLFTYEEMDKNIVPDKIILELSHEDKSRELRELENDLQIFQEYYKSTQSSMISEMSLNSKPELN